MAVWPPEYDENVAQTSLSACRLEACATTHFRGNLFKPTLRANAEKDSS